MKQDPLPSKVLDEAIEKESVLFRKIYRWLEEKFAESFLKETDVETRLILARNLLSFSLQGNWIEIRLKEIAIVICLDSSDAMLKILEPFQEMAIRYYRTFVSKEKLPEGPDGNIRIGLFYLKEDFSEKTIDPVRKKELLARIQTKGIQIEEKEFDHVMNQLSFRFVRSMNEERLESAIDLFFRAKDSDQCQYEIKKNLDWKEKEIPSLHLVIAWKGVPKAGFLYRLMKVIHFHGLVLQKAVANYVDPYSQENILLLSLGLHGKEGKAAWEATDFDDFLKELVLTKYFEIDDPVGTTFVQKGLLTGNEGHLVRNAISFVHQVLVHADPNLYSLEHIVEGFCRHPELTVRLCKIFSYKFDPKNHDEKKYTQEKKELFHLIERLDTGQAVHDLRRKQILRQALAFVEKTLKTNFYRTNKTSFAFRIDPTYLEDVPYAREEKFPEIPFGIFFVRGMHFIAFNIRFRDLARGGVRTIIPAKREQFELDRNLLFAESYHLAYTQQKKNKDIPEGGAKTAILLKPMDVFHKEEKLYLKELEEKNLKAEEIAEQMERFRKEERQAYISSSQKSFIDSLISLIHCDEKGNLLASSIIDYWKKPEYLYLGPDENISNEMIDWIVSYAVKSGYGPGRAFMSSSPKAGINHKYYGVTSYGVNVYLEKALEFLKIDPKKESFTLKMSGGPDGDVAGNEICNLYRFYPKTAKLLAITDVSGTIFDPKGLDLEALCNLFYQAQSIAHYPVEKLSPGGFLLNLQKKKEENALSIFTLLSQKEEKGIVEKWLSGNEMNLLYRGNLHQTIADVFIPAGGRPRTLNETNLETFLDENGKPSSKAIIEGANLYLTPKAREILEEKGVLIFKDSSCNKGGVITSSLEVLASLCLKEEEFLTNKETYVQEVLEIIRKAASKEATVLLKTSLETEKPLSILSDLLSEKINLFKDQIIDYLKDKELSLAKNDPLKEALLRYAPPLLRNRYEERLLKIPSLHQKAVIACFIASRLVYHKGLSWNPSITDILPTLAKEIEMIDD